MRLWRRSGRTEPAAAANAAAGARYGSEKERLRGKERLKGDVQETARQRLVIASALFDSGMGSSVIAVGIMTIGVDLVAETEITRRMGSDIPTMNDPWGARVLRIGALTIPQTRIAGLLVCIGLNEEEVERLVLESVEHARSDFHARRLIELKNKADADLRHTAKGLETEGANLDADKTFVWIKRGLSPREYDLVNRLGIPGLEFQAEERRIYPQGSTAAHIVGYASIDNSGLAGVERYFDQQLQSGERVQLSIDLRLQRLVEDEMVAAVKKFSAIGATAVVMDATNGEVIAMASLPTYDANKAKTITNEALFNRATLGVYEQGSVFKIFNTAMALDSGKVTLASVFDATSPIKIDRFTINDDHPQRRPLTVPEIFTYSSNIASAKIAADVMGPEAQRAFFDKIGFLKPLKTQVTELGSPLWPRHWMKINAMTIAFGHGMSVTPLHLATGSAARTGLTGSPKSASMVRGICVDTT